MTAQGQGPPPGISFFTEPEVRMPSAAATHKAPQWAQWAHSKKRSRKKRQEPSTDSGATGSHQRDASGQRPTAHKQDRRTTDTWEDDSWDTAGYRAKQDRDIKAWAEHKDDRTTDWQKDCSAHAAGTWKNDNWDTGDLSSKHESAPKIKPEQQDYTATKEQQDETGQTTADDDEGSELEIIATTIKVKKKIFKAVTTVIQSGFALDHRRSTMGLAQISPSKALAILGNIHTTNPANAQRYLDQSIEEVIATHGSTQPQARPMPSHVKHMHWTAELISRQLVNFVRYPTTRPRGLHVYRHDMLRIEDVMTWWGTREGLTTTEVIEAVRAHSMDRTRKRFTLVTESHRTMLMVHKHMPVGQATHRAFMLKTKLRKNSQGKKK